MNKKYLSVVLFGALLAASAGTFTSCKDYDDDIKGLQEQIDGNQSSVTALEKQLATLDAAAKAAKKLLMLLRLKLKLLRLPVTRLLLMLLRRKLMLLPLRRLLLMLKLKQ